MKELHLKVARAWAAKELLSKSWNYEGEGWARRFFKNWYDWMCVAGKKSAAAAVAIGSRCSALVDESGHVWVRIQADRKIANMRNPQENRGPAKIVFEKADRFGSALSYGQTAEFLRKSAKSDSLCQEFWSQDGNGDYFRGAQAVARVQR